MDIKAHNMLYLFKLNQIPEAGTVSAENSDGSFFLSQP
jgi:hypothetical protein